jgi:protein-S-isoprenylcysteine O-methyltransferase Ste14
MRTLPIRQLVGIPLTVATFLLLMFMGWGSVSGFLAHPVRVLTAALFVAATPVMAVCTSGRSRGVGHEPDVPWFFPALVFHSLFTCLAMPWMDARDVWTLPGGDAVRWSGLALFAAGIGLRAAAMLALGRRFASVVALQPDHALRTDGLYGVVRHPSYLGIFLMDLGLAGVFRSALALAVLPLVFAMFAHRMRIEECFMAERFGDTYRAYAARVPALWPRLARRAPDDTGRHRAA